MPILSKDGKIIINKGKVLTHFPEDAKLLTKVETILQNTNTNADEIEKIKNGEVPVGNIRSISVDGVKIEPDEEFNVDLVITSSRAVKTGTITLSNDWVEGSNSITLSEGLYLICVTYYDSELAINQTAELGVIGVSSLPTNDTVDFKKIFANYYANSTLNVHFLRISEYNTGVFNLATYKTVYSNTTSSTDIESGAKIYYKQIM